MLQVLPGFCLIVFCLVFHFTRFNNPSMITGMKNTMKRQNRTEVTTVRFFLYRTCSYLFSLPQRERDNNGGREEDEGKEGRHTVNMKAKPVPPARQSPFRGRGGGWTRGKAGFNVCPCCKTKPVNSQTCFLEICSCDKRSSSVKTVMEAQTNRRDGLDPSGERSM